MYLDHLCRNTICVNPDHLEIVTPRENVLRGFGPTAIKARQTHCKKVLHPLSGDNLYLKNGKNGVERHCRECERVRSLKWKADNPWYKDRRKELDKCRLTRVAT